MNRRRRRPLKLHLRAAPKQKVVYRSPPKLSPKIIIPGVLLALVIVGALGFAGVALLKNARTKHQTQTTIGSPSATASPSVAGTVNPVPATISSTPVRLVSATPSPAPSATPISRPTALAKATAVANSTPVASATPVANDGAPREVKTPSENARKTAEQKRREAERKRARLEALHKDHQISDEAYKQGQQEYQTEMAKYRNVVGGGASAN